MTHRYSMNLIKDPWIPVRRESGTEDIIAPWQLTETNDPIITLSAPRPDFNGALMQFLIGLLQTSATPEDENRWLDWLESPPEPETLKDCFEQYEDAFKLQGGQGAFMQDFDELDKNPWLIERLLIDSPGENTLKLNKDHFVKREKAKQLCRSCAATALFTLQVNAPGGGAGHRASLRGGGPLTTLVVMDESADLSNNLWRNIWLNILEQSELETLRDNSKTAPADIFPWLGKTRTSESGEVTTLIDVNPLQMYWGMPRRIRIKWETNNKGNCDICDTESELVTHYQTKNYGINYKKGAWRHPLSPAYYKKSTDNANNEILLTQHMQTGALTYQHWLSLTDDYENNISAKVVKRYRELAQDWGKQLRLFAFGYEMDKKEIMKARCWYETTFPLYTIPEEIQVDFSKRIQDLTDTSAKFADIVETCVKEAWKNTNHKRQVKGDTSFLKQCFYQHTENAFYQAAKTLQSTLLYGTGTNILQTWHGTLRKAALNLFDYWSTRGDFTQSDPRRIAKARNKLERQINSKNIRERLHLVKSKTLKNTKEVI